LLFVSIRPLNIGKIAEMLEADKDEVKAALEELFTIYSDEEKGINIQKQADKYQMVTNAQNAKIIRDFLKDETTGELTPASLETLTVIAYRGPIAKTELELLRGVNCSLILRNLLIRGLIEEKEDKKNMTTTYEISFDFMQHLGIKEAKELPDFDKLNTDENLLKFLQSGKNEIVAIATSEDKSAESTEKAPDDFAI
jgi:segregation and condensation protein B